MVDYVLTAAVGISAGVGALVSAVPSLEQHTLLMCLAILALITLINLRGISDSGGVFLVPDLSVHRLPAGHDRDRRGEDAGGGRPSVTR